MIPETYLKTTVLIVGKGVSGLVLNYLLEKKGIQTILLDRKTNTLNPILAETIPPSTLQLLYDLDLLSVFENCASRTYGYQSKWGTKTIEEENFFKYNPYKYGLKLNKRKLLSELENNTKTHQITCNKIINIEHKKNKVITTILINNEARTINSNLIIDATGRKRAILKQFNVKTKTYDENLAFICYVPKSNSTLKYNFFTESFKNGWGTVSNLNETTNIITLYTANKSPLHKQLTSFANWRTILQNTLVLKNHIPFNDDFKILGKQANSSVSSKIYTKNCLAIGDAAIAFDPISSHGISNAIFCASEAANAIEEFYTKKNDTVFKQYESTLHLIFNQYLKQKEKLYISKALVHN